VRRTCAAGPFQLVSKCRPRAVKSHTGVSRRNPNFIRNGAHAGPSQVNAPDHFGKLRPEQRNEVIHALADSLLQIGIGAEVEFGLACLSLQRLLAGSATAVVINDGVPQQPIKSGDRLFVVADLFGFLQAADECVLKNLLGIFTAPDASRQEVEEPTVIGEKALNRCIRFWCRVVCAHFSSSQSSSVAPYDTNCT